MHRVAFLNVPLAMTEHLSAYLREEGFEVLYLQELSVPDAETLLITPFSTIQSPQAQGFLRVLYLSDESDIETEAFDRLSPYEDVLIQPFSEEQLKYRILAMLK